METTINLVGYFKDDVNTFFEKIDLSLKGINYSVSERYYETNVTIIGTDGQVEEYIDTIRRFTNAFKTYIYGKNEENVYLCAYKLLKEKKVKIAFAEGVSGGRIASEFIAQAGEDVKDILVFADVSLSESAQIKRYGISPNFFDKYKLESVEAVYELARGALYVSGANIAVATAGTISDDEKNADNGKCFIAVGDNQMINVFKHAFTGSKNKIMQQVSKFAFLHLVRKLRDNNFEYLLK